MDRIEVRRDRIIDQFGVLRAISTVVGPARNAPGRDDSPCRRARRRPDRPSVAVVIWASSSSSWPRVPSRRSGRCTSGQVREPSHRQCRSSSRGSWGCPRSRRCRRQGRSLSKSWPAISLTWCRLLLMPMNRLISAVASGRHSLKRSRSSGHITSTSMVVKSPAGCEELPALAEAAEGNGHLGVEVGETRVRRRWVAGIPAVIRACLGKW